MHLVCFSPTSNSLIAESNKQMSLQTIYITGALSFLQSFTFKPYSFQSNILKDDAKLKIATKYLGLPNVACEPTVCSSQQSFEE